MSLSYFFLSFAFPHKIIKFWKDNTGEYVYKVSLKIQKALAIKQQVWPTKGIISRIYKIPLIRKTKATQ